MVRPAQKPHNWTMKGPLRDKTVMVACRKDPAIRLAIWSLAAVAGMILLWSNAKSQAPQTASSPTFSRDIAPILYGTCAGCHHTGGHGPFPLMSYEDAKNHSSQIAAATQLHKMPPWLPEHGYGDFAGELRLTDAQIKLIADWVNAGAPEGVPSEAPPQPHFSGDWQLGPPDMILEASSSISVPPSGPDMFWNFIFSPGIKTTRFVRGIEIRPGGGSMLVHHANLIVDPARSARLQEKQPGAGFPGMDVNIWRSALDFKSHFLFWKPGGTPWVEPDGLAWKLEPGADLVLNAHLKPMGMREDVRPSIGLYFTSTPPTKFPMLIQLQDDNALEIPPGAQDFVVSDDFTLPVDVDVLAVYPHAHYLGHLLEGYATLPTGERKWLVRIPDWDPNWQAVFHFREPVFLPKGSVVSMRYHYDNSAANPRNPNHPPKKVEGGDQTTDEMAHLWLQILPRGDRDRRPAIDEALMQHRIEKYPSDLSAHLRLGVLMLARLDPADAEETAEQAIRIDPRSPDAHNLRGIALGVLGRASEAIGEFRLALELKPDFGQAHQNLARALANSGQLDEALVQFRLAATALPENVEILNGLGELLLRRGQAAEALEQFEKAIALDPSNRSAQENKEQALKLLRHP
ncbi:MAG TPA: tetratricopeptide repeat protein [Candidatus Acidoferrum sp.]|nr:tetratricopeptide repeat protein [Candidatus Acidoferrum sp.]